MIDYKQISKALLALFAVLVSPQFAYGQSPKEGSSAAIQYDVRNGYSLAFVDADVKRVVDAVMGSMLEVSYSVDADVSGNITLRTARPVAKGSLVTLLETALSRIGVVVVQEKGSYRIISRKNARSLVPVSGVPVSGTNVTARKFEPSAPGFATEIIGLRFGSATEIARLIKDFLGGEIASASTDGRNQLLISGSAGERDSAKKLIGRFDVDALSSMNFSIYKLENVDADTLVAELDTIFEPPFDILGARVRLVPLPRLRSVLGIAASRQDLTRIEPWIKRLDAGGSGKRKLYSYSVQNGRSRDIAKSLQQVLGVGSGLAPSTTLSARSDVGATGARQNRSAESQNRDSSADQPFSPGNQGSLKIVPNEQNNSILVYANGEEYGFIKDVLEKLDRPVAQVLIEATLAEVTLTDDLRFGVDFSVLKSGSNGTARFGQSNNSSGTPASSFPGFSVSVIGSKASAVLNALQSKTNVRVLSAPKLLTLNNEPATLQVGDQVPIVTQQSQSVSAPGAPVVNNIELRDTGVILQVTPRVNDSGNITLDISQEVSGVAATTTSGINSPTIQQRRLTSTVSTRSGQMIALGGLIRNQQTRIKSGIPFLSQIPIVGGLFGRKVDTGSRTELIMLLTPTVIRSPDETKKIVDALIDGLDITKSMVERAKTEGTSGKISKP